MSFIESMVQEVLVVARIPDADTRRAVAEELRAHLADLSAQAMVHGHHGSRAESFVREHFGSPSVVGRAFEHVYRYERNKLFARVGLIVGTVLTLFATTAVYTVQRWLATRLGLESTLSVRHFSREAIMIAVAVGCYTAIVAMTRWVLPIKGTLIAWGAVTIGLIALTVILAPGTGRAMGLGVIFAAVMCASDTYFRAWASRIGIHWLVASLVGLLLATFMMADASRPILFTVPIWLLIAFAISTAASTASALGSRILARRFAS